MTRQAIGLLIFGFLAGHAMAGAQSEGPKKVFFIRIDFAEKPGALATKPELQTTLAIVSKNIAEQSYGKASIVAGISNATIRLPGPLADYFRKDNNGAVVPGQALPLELSSLDKAIAGYNQQETGTKEDLSKWNVVVVVVPNFGATNLRPGSQNGNHIFLYDNRIATTIIHELGHYFGRPGHANFWNTNGQSVVGAGTSEDMGDPFDIMGGGVDGNLQNSNAADAGTNLHFSMATKASFNWLTPTQWVDANVKGSGTYRLYRFDDPGTTGIFRGLRARKGSTGDYYWLGYRGGVPSNAFLRNGAYMLWESSTVPRGLLDATPGSKTDWRQDRLDGALAVGKTHSDFAANVHFTPVAVGGSGANSWLDVNVQLGPFPGNRPPTATLSGPATATANSPQQFSVTASDPDGNPLAYSWDFGDGSPVPSSASVAKSWAAGGTYAVSVTVSDMRGGIVKSNSVQVVVSSPLDRWTQRTTDTNAALKDIALGGGRLVAVGSGVSLTSTDGILWTKSQDGAGLPNFQGVIHDGSKFVAASQAGVFTSSDGLAWTSQPTAAGADLRDIAFGSGVYIACGNGGKLLRSTNGSTWSPVVVPGVTTANLTGVSFGAGKFVVSGRDSNTFGPIVLTSSNGLTWTNTTAGVAGGFVVGSLQFCRDRFLGEAVPLGFDPVMKIFASTDAGASFALSPAEIIQGAEGSFPAFAYGNGIYFSAGAYNYADFANQIFINEAPTNQVSTDGVTWRALGAPPSQSVRTGAVFFKNTFITVGGGGQIWQSDPFVGVANSVDARANLSSLTVSGGTLSPAFASGTIDYQAVVQNSTASITVTPTAVDSQATIQVNFVPVASGAKSPAIPLNVGANPITVLVTAQDGSTKIYNVVVTRLGLATVTNLANSGAGSLRQAVTDLNLAGGGTINLSVTGTILLTGGELVLSSNLTINGPSTGAKQLTISGNGASRVFRVTSAATVAIAKVTMVNGRAPKGAAEKPGGDGGAIQNSGKLTLTSCRISDSVAGTGGATTTGVPRAGGNGGAIYNASTGTLTLSACLLDNNTAGVGGACTAGPSGTKGGAGGNGGAVCNQGGRMTLVNTTISGNFAGKGGLGLSGVSDGSGGSGGGVQALNSLLAKFTACTISNNYVGAGGAYGLGGGINAVGTAAAARPTLANVLVARNSARDNSTGLGLIRSDLAGAFVSGKGNFVGVFDGASWASVGTGLKPDVTGTAALPADPRMGILADNGGVTSTHLLLPGSGAMAAGGSGLVTTDQLGRVRPVIPDIGAYQTLEMAGLSANGGAKAVNGNFYVWGSSAANTPLNLKEGPAGTFTATIPPNAATGTMSNPKRIMVFLGGGNDTMTTATTTGVTNAIAYEVYGGPGNDILSLNAAIPVPNVRFYGEEGEDFLQTNGASATPSPIVFDGGPGQDGVEFFGTDGNNNIVVNWYAIGPHDGDEDELLEPPFPDHRDGLRVTIDGKKFEMEYTPKDDDETIVIWGGKGNDRIEMADDGAGQHWNAEFYGEEGDDVLIGATRLFHKPRGHDLLEGGPGNDQLFGNSGNDLLIGGEGQNLIVSGSGVNHVSTYGNDRLWLNRGDTLTILVPVTGKGKKPHKTEERKKPYEAKLKLDGPVKQDTRMQLTPVDGLLSADVRFDTPGDYRLELKISPPPGPRHKLEFELKVQDIPPLPE